MYNLKSFGAAALAGACLALGAMSANAAEAATSTGCIKSAKEVQAALDANPQSPNYDSAAKEKRNALEFCNSGLYQQGVDRYADALKLLDPAKS